MFLRSFTVAALALTGAHAIAGSLLADANHPATQALLHEPAMTANPANFANPKVDTGEYRIEIECSPKRDDTFGKILDPQRIAPEDFICTARPSVGFTRAPAGASPSPWTLTFNLKLQVLKVLVNKTDFMYMAGNYTIFTATAACDSGRVTRSQPYCEFRSR